MSEACRRIATNPGRRLKDRSRIENSLLVAHIGRQAEAARPKSGRYRMVQQGATADEIKAAIAQAHLIADLKRSEQTDMVEKGEKVSPDLIARRS